MGTPPTYRDCRLSSAALEKLNLLGGRVRTSSECSPYTASVHRAIAGSHRLAGGVRGFPNCVG
jgi:hypothetical protein